MGRGTRILRWPIDIREVRDGRVCLMRALLGSMVLIPSSWRRIVLLACSVTCYSWGKVTMLLTVVVWETVSIGGASYGLKCGA